MQILVTGASGFLGRALCAKLETQGHTVTKLTSRNDLTKLSSLVSGEIFHRFYDVIYHLAAWTQAGDFCLHHQGDQWVINQQINTNVLKCLGISRG